ncbi:hypothetical protein [Pontibacter korlensis]|uniref:hypothetical protein n=1 Tax=Pontibacter korlensis TaxID=400092 RepID=UPI000A037A7A
MAVDPVHPLVIPAVALPPDPMEALPEADGRVLLHQQLQLLGDEAVVFLFWSVLIGASGYTRCPASLTHAHPVLLYHNPTSAFFSPEPYSSYL